VKIGSFYKNTPKNRVKNPNFMKNGLKISLKTRFLVFEKRFLKFYRFFDF